MTELLEGSPVVEITVVGRRTGRERSIVVNFVREGGRLYLLPVRGSDSAWYKDILKTPQVRLAVNGVELRARVRPITDPVQVREVVDKFERKYGPAEMRFYSNLDVAVEVLLTPDAGGQPR